MKHCPLCNTEYEATENFCKKDGTKLVEKSQPKGKKCPKCGKTYPSEAAFCMVCGLKLISENEKPTCSNCGAELPDGALFCMKCGTKVDANSSMGRNIDKSSNSNDGLVAKEGKFSDISIAYPTSWSFENNFITIKSRRIQNNSNESSGTLKIKLWYCDSVYNGGTIDGYTLGESIFCRGGLAPTFGYTDFNYTFSLTGNPPTGDYYSTVTISELSDDGSWYIVGWINFEGIKHWEHK